MGIIKNEITTERVTNGPKHHLFGFHDLLISNKAGNKYLCLEVDIINRPPLPDEKYGVGYVENGQFVKVGDTTALNYPQGARRQWVGAQAAGFPFKMMEYASAGRPIVSSEIGKLDDEYNCHITYYDSEQPEAVAAAVEDVIAHYDERVALALDLQKKVLSEYGIEGTGKKLNMFLKEIKNGK